MIQATGEWLVIWRAAHWKWYIHKKYIHNCTSCSWDTMWLSIPGERLRANSFNITLTHHTACSRKGSCPKHAVLRHSSSSDLSDFPNVQINALLGRNPDMQEYLFHRTLIIYMAGIWIFAVLFNCYIVFIFHSCAVNGEKWAVLRCSAQPQFAPCRRADEQLRCEPLSLLVGTAISQQCLPVREGCFRGTKHLKVFGGVGH